ncbi:MAG: glycoside hydrolase family 6 protein [Dermatophilaceae bacterium]
MTVSRVVTIAVAVAAAIAAGVGVALLTESGDGTVVVRGAADARPPVQSPSSSSRPTVDPPAVGLDLPESEKLFVDPRSRAANWVASNPDHPDAELVRSAIATKPGVQWFGWWSSDLGGDVGQHLAAAAKTDSVPVMGLYERGFSECPPLFSVDDAALDSFLARIQSMADEIGESKVILFLQPRFIQTMTCVEEPREQTLRLRAMRQAIGIFEKSAPEALTYLDGSVLDSGSADTIALLHRAGLARAHGLALNLAATMSTASKIEEATTLNAALQSRHGYTKPYVIDTSVNGRLVDDDVCNSPQLRIGEAPRRGEPGEGPEYLLWFSNPGESTGDCGMAKGTAPGQFVPKLAVSMAGGAER